MNSLYFLIFFTFGLQVDWLEQTKELIIDVDNNSILVNTKLEEEKNGTITKKEFIADQIRKVQVIMDYPSSINLEINYYDNEGFIFGEVIKGTTVLLYKRNRLDDEPYASIIESQTYFKNKNEGINLIRELNLYEGDDIENIKKKLQKMEFEQRSLGSEDYIRSEEHTSELQSRPHLVCRLLLEKKKCGLTHKSGPGSVRLERTHMS